MTIEKLPSGSYRITQMHKGKRYRITLDYKPTKKEAVILIGNEMASEGHEMPQKGTLKEFADKFIIKCEKRQFEQTTIKGYKSIIKNTPKAYSGMNLFDFDEDTFQDMVDTYHETPKSKNKKFRSPKTVKNFYSFYDAVFSEYRPKFTYSIELPLDEKKDEYRPYTKDVKAILKEVEGTRYHIPLTLASIGLRRGEICALTLADLSDDNILTINKAMIVDSDNNQVIKNTPKTKESNRRILIPATLANEIRANGCIFEGNMHTINEHLHLVQDRLEIPRFRLHILRHFSAAYMHKQGFTDSQVLAYHGWKEDSSTMQKVYRYNLDPEESQKDIAEAYQNLI